MGPCPEGHRDGKGLVGHAGAVLLRKAADQAGLTGWLSGALKEKRTSPLIDRGIAMVSMAAAIALGATSMSDIALLAHLAPLLGAAPSGPTVRRALDLAGTPRMLDRIARARAKARAHAWALIAATAAGFPWLAVAGKVLEGRIVIDMDATLVTAHSDKEGAAPTWKKGYGFHPLGAWCRNTRECLAMLLRPGNAGSNTFTDHKEVLAAALRQVPSRFRWKIMVRVDGAGASHDLGTPAVPQLEAEEGAVHDRVDDHRRRRACHRQGPRLRVEARDLPGRHRRGGQGRRRDHAPAGQGGELAGRPAVHRPEGEAVPPAGREPDRLREENRVALLRDLHEHPGRGDRRGSPAAITRSSSTCCTASTPAWRPPGLRTAKAMGLRGLPSKAWQVNCGWVITANIAADLAAWHPSPRAPRRPRTPRRHPGHAPLPDLAPPRQARPSRPPAHPRHQRNLAMGTGRSSTCWHRLCAGRTDLTSTNKPSDTEGGPPRDSRSRCTPGHTGNPAHPTAQSETDTRIKNGSRHNQ